MADRPGRRQQHRYDRCKDQDCDRPLCAAYREGYRQGYADKPPEVVYVGGK
jgi:hypothetical protein